MFDQLHKRINSSIRVDPDFISILILLVFGLVAYSNSFTASFHLDDTPHIILNEAIHDLTDLGSIFNYSKERFLPYLTLAINYSLSQHNPTSYHTVNFFIHYFAAIFLYFLFLEIWKTPIMRGVELDFSKRVGGFVAAGIFFLHPLQTESVTYIIQRTESMAGMFYLATLLFYLKARNAGTRSTLMVYAVSAGITAFCSAFSKETAVTLPVMLVVFELFLFDTSIRDLLKNKLLLVFLLPAGIILFSKLNPLVQRDFFHDPGIHFTRKQYIFTQFSVLLTYLRLFFWPANQNVDWDYPIATEFFSLPTLISFLFLLLLLILAIVLNKRIRLLSLAILAFFITLAPTSSIIPIKDVIFEHRMYLAVAFLGVGCVHLLFYSLQKMRQNSLGGHNIAALAFIITILPILATLTYARNEVWLDEVSLWGDAIQKSPNKARPHNNYGVGLTLLRNKINEQAKREYEIARRLDPDWAKPYHNLALAALQEGDYQQAIALDLEAIKRGPEFKVALYSLGRSYMKLNQWDNARLHLEKLINLSPGKRFVKAYVDLIEVYLQLGFSDKALALAKSMPPLDYHRGMAYYKLKDFDQAKYYFARQEEQESKRVSACLMMGQIYYLKKNYQDATRVFRLALEKNPRSWAAHYNLSLILEKSEKFQEAADHLEQVRAMDPFSLAPSIHLIRLYNNLGESSKRLELTRKLLGLRPDSVEFNFLEANGHQNWNYTLQGYAKRFLCGSLSPSEEKTMAIILSLNGDHVGAIERYQRYLQAKPRAAEKRRIEKELERLEEVLNGMEPLTIPS